MKNRSIHTQIHEYDLVLYSNLALLTPCAAAPALGLGRAIGAREPHTSHERLKAARNVAVGDMDALSSTSHPTFHAVVRSTPAPYTTVRDGALEIRSAQPPP